MIIRDATTALELKYDARNNAAAADEQVCNLAGRKDVRRNMLTSREMCERLFVARVRVRLRYPSMMRACTFKIY